MSWTHYRLRFRLLSPMHIGYHEVGNLMKTRPYVPGKALWAALTARITRDYHKGNVGSDYKRVGWLLQNNFRFGYLWPSLDGKAPYFPWGHDDFDYLLLGSYSSTALNYNQQTSAKGTLRETEFIAPSARNGRAVYLLSDLWAKANLPEEICNWQIALAAIQLGGERTYGWGRVETESGLTTQDKTIDRHSWTEQNNEEIILKLTKGAQLAAHALAVDYSDDTGQKHWAVHNVSGPIEPLVGRETVAEGHFGKQISKAHICYTPGSLVMDNNLTCRIGPYGIWEAVLL